MKKQKNRLIVLLIAILLIVMFLVVNNIVEDQNETYVTLSISTRVSFGGDIDDPPRGPANPLTAPQNMTRGDEITIIDGLGNEGRISIRYITDDYVVIRVTGRHFTVSDTPIRAMGQAFNIHYGSRFTIESELGLGSSGGWILVFTKE